MDSSLAKGIEVEEFPEDLILANLDNTWRDTASAVVGKWMGLVYQLTSMNRDEPFMIGIDPDNPLNLPQ